MLALSFYQSMANILHPDVFQVVVAIDQLANTLLGGMADETLSARAWRHHLDGSRDWPYKLIDTLFFWQKDHCHTAYESELKRRQLPVDYREE